MADPLKRLQTSLRGRYTIERELGRGGTATVYLANDLKHHRGVAIKVFRPEVAAAIGAEPFLREISISAPLNHPHILPLHDSGEAGGFLYYVMPYVAGESLRARLERQRQLPLNDALQIAREVADALAYAHSLGIVHRDIKPENILFAAGHAIVGDFGIARAITAAGGEKLTTTGIAVGTPAYMSPEQATGSERLDGRSDVYSLGCVLYEMLSGEPPFTGPRAQVIAAHVTATPRPLPDLRPETPPTVARVIAQALTKDPNARFPTAVEFRDAISSLAAGTHTAFALVHPGQLVALLGVGSLAVLGVVYVLILGLGLPDWVLVGALALLALGLPIMLVAGALERRRERARASGSLTREPPGIRRWFTWRHSFLGGAVAFSGLGVATAVYMAMRLLGIGPVATLVASGELKTREPLLLASFENRTTDSTLGPSLSEAFRVDLSQSTNVKLLDPQAVADALQRMRRPAGTPLDLHLARELAQREGVKAVVTGVIDPVGKGYQLSASVVAATDGRVLTAVRATAADDRVLISAIDRLSRKLRERIGESLKSIRATAPLEHVTTGSLDALRRYSEAVRAEYAGDIEGAAALYQAAAAIDTEFAMAYRKVGAMLLSTGPEDRSVAATTKAFALRYRLPDIERYLTTAFYYSTVDYDPAEAVAAYRSVLERDPDNPLALGNIASQLNNLHQFREAESLAVRGTLLGPRVPRNTLQNAMVAHVAQGHFDDAETTLARFERAAPHDPLVLWDRALLASAKGAYPAAEQAARALQDEQRSSTWWTHLATHTLAAVDAARGRLSRAEREDDELMALNERRASMQLYLLSALDISWIDLRLRNKPARGLRAIESVLRRHPLVTMPPLERPYVALGRFYAAAGRLEEASRLLTEYERTIPEGIRRTDGERHGLEGDLFLARGRIADAIARYQAWYDEGTCGYCTENESWFEIARAWEQGRKPDSALTYYERFVAMPSLFRVEEDKRMLGPALKRLGELYEARGDRAKALEYYGRFVDLWKDADPELQPLVASARATLARLSAEPR